MSSALEGMQQLQSIVRCLSAICSVDFDLADLNCQVGTCISATKVDPQDRLFMRDCENMDASGYVYQFQIQTRGI